MGTNRLTQHFQSQLVESIQRVELQKLPLAPVPKPQLTWMIPAQHTGDELQAAQVHPAGLWAFDMTIKSILTGKVGH